MLEPGQIPPRTRRLRLTGFDVSAIRSLLRGESVIDWHRLEFTTQKQVARFLRLNEFHIEVPSDMDYLERLRGEAVDYLRRTFQLKVPSDLAHKLPAKDLLLVASGKARRQLAACMILKVMLILHHLDGHELDYRLPVSRDELTSLVEAKVVQVVEEIRATDLPIVEFSWSRKSRDSLITKLLSKNATIASKVYDRLRFRIVVKEHDHLVQLLWELLHRLIPFNYVIPGESKNRLLQTEDLLKYLDTRHRKGGKKIEPPELPRLESAPVNEFSSPHYRIINFVTDLPIRVETFLDRVPSTEWTKNVPMTFVLAEFQIADWQTAKSNESGDCSHDRYKQRQLDRVKARLSNGRPGVFPTSRKPRRKKPR
jgi:uncharacterized protein (TIGR04552 family)